MPYSTKQNKFSYKNYWVSVMNYIMSHILVKKLTLIINKLPYVYNTI